MCGRFERAGRENVILFRSVRSCEELREQGPHRTKRIHLREEPADGSRVQNQRRGKRHQEGPFTEFAQAIMHGPAGCAIHPGVDLRGGHCRGWARQENLCQKVSDRRCAGAGCSPASPIQAMSDTSTDRWIEPFGFCRKLEVETRNGFCSFLRSEDFKPLGE